MIVILLITAFFYGKPPEAVALIQPGIDRCVELGTQVKTDLEKQGDVQAVEYACLGVKEANKA